MERIATTFRIDPAVKARLSKLSKITNASLNQLANEAIEEFIERRSLEVEAELESTLEALRACRRRDPDFEQAIAEIAEAETTGQQDPAEGKVVSAVGRNEAVVLDLLNE